MRSAVLCLAAFSLLLLAPDGAQAARQRKPTCHRWVAPDASGSDNGQSATTPWTLAQANAPDADAITICLLSGVYVITGTNVGIDPTRTLTLASQRITYQPAPGAVPVLTFATTGSSNTCIRLTKDFYTVTNLVCRGSDHGEEQYVDDDDEETYDGLSYELYLVDRGAVIEAGVNQAVVSNNAFHWIEDAAIHVAGSDAQVNRILENDISHVGCNHSRDMCGSSLGAAGIRLGPGASNNYVAGNKIRDVSGAAIRLENPTGSLSVVDNIVYGNHIANAWLGAIEVEENDGSRPTRRNVIEDNVITSVSTQTDATVAGGDHRGIVVRAPANVVRYNRLTASGADGIAIQTSTSWPLASSNKIYNNTIVQSVLAGLTIDHDGGSSGALAANVILNNLISANATSSTSPAISGAPPSATQVWIPDITTLADLAGTSIRGNLLIEDKHDIASPREVFRIDALGGCDTIFDQATGCADANVAISDNADDVDASDEGLALTTVATGGCNGTLLDVVDAGFFSDGIVQISGVLGDAIQVGTSTATVGITSINGNQLTVFPAPSSCAAGDPVSLIYADDGPAIGAARGE